MALSTSGSLDAGGLSLAKLGAMDRAISGMGSSIASFGGKMSDAFTGAVEKAGDLAFSMAKIGGVAIGGAAVYGVVKLNAELEKTTVSLGAIFNANGVASGMPQGMAMAGDMIKQIRKDAAALPGETEDLMGIYRSVLIPGLRTGKSAAELEKFSANVMAAGAASGLDMATVAREAGALVAGRAGGHNILGSTLFGLTGDKAQAFNKSSGSDRMAFLTDQMGKYGAAIATFGGTFDAISSTLKDNAKGFLRSATEPLFEKAKGSMSKINDWFDNNKTLVNSWADYIGSKLGQAWDSGTQAIIEWWPAIRTFAAGAFDGIVGIWQAVEPIVKNVAGYIRDAMGDGSMLNKIGDMLKLYAVVKGGSMVMGGMGGMSGVASVAAATGPEGMLVLAAAAIAAGGELYALADASSKYHAAAVSAASDLSESMGNLKQTMSGDTGIGGVFQSLGVALTFSMSAVIDTFDQILHPMDLFRDILYAMPGMDRPPELNADPTYEPIKRNFELGGKTFLKALGDGAAKAPMMAKGAGGGGGGTVIHKVEITVSSNQEPSRIARLVNSELANLARHPRSSRGVPNFSAAR